jgi:hypothetical protein
LRSNDVIDGEIGRWFSILDGRMGALKTIRFSLIGILLEITYISPERVDLLDFVIQTYK